MNATRHLFQQRQPMIKFIGKHNPPSRLDHTPHAHPAAPTQALPNSFASYRQKAQQHGPLNVGLGNIIGGHSGHSLGPVSAGQGEAFDRSELPARFRRMKWSAAEIEAVESGGASMFA